MLSAECTNCCRSMDCPRADAENGELSTFFTNFLQFYKILTFTTIIVQPVHPFHHLNVHRIGVPLLLKNIETFDFNLKKTITNPLGFLLPPHVFVSKSFPVRLELLNCAWKFRFDFHKLKISNWFQKLRKLWPVKLICSEMLCQTCVLNCTLAIRFP